MPKYLNLPSLKWITQLTILLSFTRIIEGAERFNITVKYPPLNTTHFQPQVCVSLRVPQGKSYVTGLKPLGRVDKFHHMALFTCLEPGHLEPTEAPGHYTHAVDPSPYWACLDEPIEGMVFAPACKRRRRIFAWDEDPQEIIFPEGYGYEVGPESGNFYFVFTLHYVSPPLPDDHIRMEIYFSESVDHSFAVIDNYINGFTLPPQIESFVDCGLLIQDDVDLTPFGFHPHTHGLGLMISGYKVTSGGEWDLIGKARVLTSENIHQSRPEIRLRKGDLLAFRCTFYNPNSYSVHEGRKFSSEMCMYQLWFVFNRRADPNVKLMYVDECLGEEEFARAANFTTFPEDASILERP